MFTVSCHVLSVPASHIRTIGICIWPFEGRMHMLVHRFLLINLCQETSSFIRKSLLIGKYGEKLLLFRGLQVKIRTGSMCFFFCCFFLLRFIVFLLLFLLLRPEASLRDPRDVKIQELTNSGNRKMLKEFLFH